jgi:phenylalanyl-tRNA synthetase beta chain
VKVPVSWLREFVEVPVEPERLGADLTMVGLALDGLESDGGDWILDLDVTTNRVDCMNVYGVAREVSVLYGKPLRPLALDFPEQGVPASESFGVAIEAKDLCPRFCARVLDVRLGPSPAWLRERLEKVGVRPINNMVDLTNYVMMEMGHPSHAFDLEHVPGAKLIARWARDGETLTTLDDVERRLSPRIGVVAHPDGPLAVAGVMGGGSSEVSGTTRVVALEAAYWEPLAIRRAARALGMHTEASHRFERGADYEGAARATARIAHLLAKIGAGSARPGLIDVVAAPPAARRPRLRPARVALVLGASVPEARSREILEGLGFGCGPSHGDGFEVTVPTWRGDASREIDLIEEVARHNGLGRIPSTLPEAREAGALTSAQRRERRLRDVLVAAGLNEVVGLSFVNPSPLEEYRTRGLLGAEQGNLVRLANPISEEQSALRNGLVVPGLLEALRVNLRQGRRDVTVFEIGRVFHPADRLAREERRLGVLLHGNLRTGQWSEKPRAADFFDLTGLLEAAAGSLGLEGLTLACEGAPGFLHPGQSATVALSGSKIGWAGALHPDFVRALDLREAPLVAEIRIEEMLAAMPRPVRMEPLPRFPPVLRDLSLLCDATLPSAVVLEDVRASAGPALRGVSLADRYSGPPVPAGKVSLMLSLRYQDPARTLTSEEVEASVGAVVTRLRARGIEIRGE